MCQFNMFNLWFLTSRRFKKWWIPGENLEANKARQSWSSAKFCQGVKFYDPGLFETLGPALKKCFQMGLDGPGQAVGGKSKMMWCHVMPVAVIASLRALQGSHPFETIRNFIIPFSFKSWASCCNHLLGGSRNQIIWNHMESRWLGYEAQIMAAKGLRCQASAKRFSLLEVWVSDVLRTGKEDRWFTVLKYLKLGVMNRMNYDGWSCANAINAGGMDPMKLGNQWNLRLHGSTAKALDVLKALSQLNAAKAQRGVSCDVLWYGC